MIPPRRSAKVFGNVSTLWGRHEEQGRHTLHFHFLVWLGDDKDEVLRRVAQTMPTPPGERLCAEWREGGFLDEALLSEDPARKPLGCR